MLSKVSANLIILGLAVAAILAVGLAAFRLSFVGLRELAVMAAIPAGDAWLFPVVIDITTAIAAALALAATDNAVRQWFSRVLIVGTLVSIAGNGLHSVLRGQPLPTWGCVMVVAVAPIAVFADVHGLVLLIASTTRIPSAVPASPVLTREPAGLTPVPADPPMVAVSVAVAPPPRMMPIPAPILPPDLPVRSS
ncbi:DUF2637 domain-containing protein [Nocardia sp. NPDC005825]|uniref:DUF2637 domain-containing protein n=1 Tax=unclassified Nocardia TaxID=2637762 RepID=UPI0033EB5C49